MVEREAKVRPILPYGNCLGKAGARNSLASLSRVCYPGLSHGLYLRGSFVQAILTLFVYLSNSCSLLGFKTITVVLSANRAWFNVPDYIS